MTNLKPGDKINCRLKYSEIVSPYNPDYDEIYTFEIIGKDHSGYYLYVPTYFNVKGSSILDEDGCDYFNINKKFAGEQMIYIKDSLIVSVKSKNDGCYCVSCGEYYYMAEPNQPDGSLVCWSCRVYPHYR